MTGSAAQRHQQAAQQRLNRRLGSERVAALHAWVDEFVQDLAPDGAAVE